MSFSWFALAGRSGTGGAAHGRLCTGEITVGRSRLASRPGASRPAVLCCRSSAGGAVPVWLVDDDRTCRHERAPLQVLNSPAVTPKTLPRAALDQCCRSPHRCRCCDALHSPRTAVRQVARDFRAGRPRGSARRPLRHPLLRLVARLPRAARRPRDPRRRLAQSTCSAWLAGHLMLEAGAMASTLPRWLAPRRRRGSALRDPRSSASGCASSTAVAVHRRTDRRRCAGG